MGKTKYNGHDLPGFNTARPPTPESPRWMIVWDARGWTAPVRRVVNGFNGKFTDTDGNSWDYGSELPSEYMGDEWKEWREVPLSCISGQAAKNWHFMVENLNNW